jgi:sn-glycerol 3-phosphate transport system substrate-binding protein
MLLLKRAVAAAALFSASLAVVAAPAQVEIQFWHSMKGELGVQVDKLADRFNQSQKNYKLVPLYKGSYAESMSAMLAAAHAGKAPDIIQVDDADTETMFSASAGGSAKHKKFLMKPLYQVMTEAGHKFDFRIFLPALSSYYSDKNGRMLALPFNSATPVFYYNKDAFRKAGLDPEIPPKTWPEVQAAAQAILDVHATRCVYTTGVQSWVHVENLHAWDDEEFATRLNGYDGGSTDLVFNDRLEVRHIALLEAWLKGTLFSRSRDTNEAELRFADGGCAMLTSSSVAYVEIKRNANFDVAVARLPYYEDYRGAPQNTLAGGGSLWVMAGKKPAAYKGIAQFFAFLTQPELQAEWHQQTGYLPLTIAAYELSKKQGYYEQNPGAEISVLEVSANKPTPISRGIHLGDFAQIRKVIDEELDNVWSGKKPPKQALDDAVTRGNELLHKFESANK